MLKYFESVADFLSKPLKTRPLAVFSLISFIFIIMRLYLDVQPLILLVSILVLLIVILYVNRKINLFITLFIISSVVLGISVSSYHIADNRRIRDALNNQEVRVYGTITSVPEKNTDGANFFVDADAIYYNGGTFKNKVRIYTRVFENIDFKFGDRIAFNALCQESYSDNKNTKYTFISKGAPIKADITVMLEKDVAKFPTIIVSTIRNYILDIGDRFFDGETSMMFKALAAGDKSGYSKELVEKMSIAGISHIAAVSGLHVSILGLAMYNLIKKKSRKTATFLSVVFVLLFALVTGASPSTVRATIMFISFLLSKLFIRENDSFTALCFSAMILALVNPYVIYDWGFILSFLSVLGIMIFSNPISKRLKFLPKFLREAISMTVSAQIMTFPALTSMFGEISVYSVIANIIVSTFFLATLCLCIIFVPLSFIPFVNTTVAFITGLFLDAVINTAGLFAALPFNVIYANAFNLYEHIVYYVVVLIFVMRKQLSEYSASIILGLCSLILIYGAYSETMTVKEREIAYNSLIIEKENTVLFVQDDLYDVYLEIKEMGVKNRIDSIVINPDTYIDEKVIQDINYLAKIKCIHIPAGNKDTDFVLMAQRRGINIEYYTHEKEDLYEYAKKLAK